MITKVDGDEKCSQVVIIAWWAAGYLQEYWFAIEVHEMADSDMVQQPMDREVVTSSAFLQQPIDKGVVSNMLQQPVERVGLAGLDLMQQPVKTNIDPNMLQQPVERVAVAMPSAWIPPPLGLCKSTQMGPFLTQRSWLELRQ